MEILRPEIESNEYSSTRGSPTLYTLDLMSGYVTCCVTCAHNILHGE